MKPKTQYQVTIGYKAVVSIVVKATNEKEAKEKALELFKTEKDKFTQSKHIDLQDDNYGAHGICDLDASWNMVQN